MTVAEDKRIRRLGRTVCRVVVAAVFLLLPARALAQCVWDWTLVPGQPDTWSTEGVGATDAVDSYACTARDESGPEYTYTFTATRNGSHTVTLSGMSADLDVLVLDADTGCLGSSCLAFGDTSATWTATAGHEYYIVVDGFGGASGDYTIELSAPAATTPEISVSQTALWQSCFEGQPCESSGIWIANGGIGTLSYTVSDDAAWMAVTPTSGTSTGEDDLLTVAYTTTGLAAGVHSGTITVAAPGAANTPVTIAVDLNVIPDATCTPAATLEAGVFTAGNNGATGSTNLIETYLCEPSWPESGPEYAYTFTPTTSGEYSAAVLVAPGVPADLDVFVLDGADGCHVTGCTAHGDVIATWTATAGHTYYVVVDGFWGSVGDYEIVITPSSGGNTAPIIDPPIGDRVATEGSTLAFTVAATDLETDGVTFSLAPGAPVGAQIDPATGAFSWTPGFGDAGDHTLTFRATDDGTPSLTGEQAVVITVLQPAGPLFFDDFADGPAPADWQVLSGKFVWSATRPYYKAASTVKKNVALVLPIGPAQTTAGGAIQAKTKITAFNRPNAMFVFSYLDPTHYRWVKVTPRNVQFGQTGDIGGVTAGLKAKVPAKTSVGRYAVFTVQVHPGGLVEVYKDGGAAPVASFTFPGGAVPGGVGVGANRTKTIFDDVTVWEDSVLTP